MANFYTYTSDGQKTLSAICSSNNCNKSELFTINSQPYEVMSVVGQKVQYEKTTIGQYLQSLDLKGEKIPKGFSFRIPVPLTGGVNTQFSAQQDLTALETTPEGTDTKYNNTPLMSLAMKESDERKSTTHSTLRSFASNYFTGKNFNCSVSVLLDGGVQGTWSLPVFPNEFNDSNSAVYSAQSMLGRSVDYQIYQGSSRSVSFVLNLHEELCEDYNYVHQLVAFIESAAYPGYAGGVVQVPEISFIIGSQFKIRGILSSCSATWKAPIINGKLVNCDLSVSVTETTGPFSQYDIRNKGGRR